LTPITFCLLGVVPEGHHANPKQFEGFTDSRDILREIHLLSLGDLMCSMVKNQLPAPPVSRWKPLDEKVCRLTVSLLVEALFMKLSWETSEDVIL
jgi:hypothetical protein